MFQWTSFVICFEKLLFYICTKTLGSQKLHSSREMNNNKKLRHIDTRQYGSEWMKKPAVSDRIELFSSGVHCGVHSTVNYYNMYVCDTVQRTVIKFAFIFAMRSKLTYETCLNMAWACIFTHFVHAHNAHNAHSVESLFLLQFWCCWFCCYCGRLLMWWCCCVSVVVAVIVEFVSSDIFKVEVEAFSCNWIDIAHASSQQNENVVINGLNLVYCRLCIYGKLNFTVSIHLTYSACTRLFRIQFWVAFFLCSSSCRPSVRVHLHSADFVE